MTVIIKPTGHLYRKAGIHLSRDTLVGCVLRTNARAPCWIDKGA